MFDLIERARRTLGRRKSAVVIAQDVADDARGGQSVILTPGGLSSFANRGGVFAASRIFGVGQGEIKTQVFETNVPAGDPTSKVLADLQQKQVGLAGQCLLPSGNRYEATSGLLRRVISGDNSVRLIKLPD